MRPGGPQADAHHPTRRRTSARLDPKFTTFRLFPQDPTACQADPPFTRRPPFPPHRQAAGVLGTTGKEAGHSRCSTLEHHHTIVRRVCGPGHPAPPMTGKRGCQMLLRKEVIQPHLPVRLPCYDLVPIASPTFDSSLSYELGHRLRVLPTFVT